MYIHDRFYFDSTRYGLKLEKSIFFKIWRTRLINVPEDKQGKLTNIVYGKA